MTKIKTFDDLKFFGHRVINGAKHAFMEFPNGEWISVVGGPSLYGDGETTFEVLSSQNEAEPSHINQKSK
jgi:hypothetical protein